MPDAQAIGKDAEHRAATLLLAAGLQLVRRNYRCRGGEIDLVMRDKDALVFVEVRFRRSDTFGGALASIDRHKQRRVTIAAQHYLQRHPWSGPCRFDVVGLGPAPDAQSWIRNAFTL